MTYRDENGQFTSRAQLKKVPKLGPKAFEQAAGFLRLPDAKNALDNTDIHPESYKIAEALLKEAGVTTPGAEAGQALRRFNNQATADRLGVGLPTLQDVIASLGNPGRDLRDDAPGAVLRSDVLSLKDLKPGMQLQDLGVHEDGLVHISRMAKRMVKNPHEIVAVGDIVTVWVVDVDVKRERIGLSMVAPKEN